MNKFQGLSQRAKRILKRTPKTGTKESCPRNSVKIKKSRQEGDLRVGLSSLC